MLRWCGALHLSHALPAYVTPVFLQPAAYVTPVFLQPAVGT
jgi:hypothetical protein